MSPIFRHSDPVVRRLSPVVIADEGLWPLVEGVIERVHRLGERVEVTMLLSDGTDGVARMEAGDWDWLELRDGDIVPVRHLCTVNG
jgi:hypothetical protein